jgi:undecaprenyl diphosphate synthase
MSDNTTVPTHLGLILDGNRRWAKQQGLPTLEGHRQGADTFKEISRAAFERGVKYVSAYVFSNENWSRTEEEVGYLMKLLVRVVTGYLDEVHENNIKIVVLGRREGLNKTVLNALEKAEARTADNTKGTIALCFNYGGQEELVDAYKNMLKAGVTADEVTAETIAQNLYGPEVPPVDFLIRTSGEQRTSGYMLYRSAYAELYFTDKFWPDFSVADLDAALEEYANRQRRFGK